MIAKIMDKVITSFVYLPKPIARTGKRGKADKTYLGMDENDPEKVGTINAKNIKTQ
jgi:hypothetical protein